MTKVQVSIRNINPDVFKEFKAQVVKEGLNVGKAITFAMIEWLEQKNPKKDFLELKPFDWGPGTENTSKDMDRILYGETT